MTDRELVIEKLKAGARLVVHSCSLCGCPCAYEWYNGALAYDSACDCVPWHPPEWRGETELDYYLAQPQIRQRWGIDQPAAAAS